jgi:cobalamin biosynthesis protein CbiD
MPDKPLFDLVDHADVPAAKTTNHMTAAISELSLTGPRYIRVPCADKKKQGKIRQQLNKAAKAQRKKIEITSDATGLFVYLRD